jgi:lysophospholipase L1-like esterase
MPATSSGLPRRILFTAVTVLGFFGTAELILRQLEPPRRFRRPTGFPAHLQLGPELGWQLEPGSRNSGPTLRTWEEKWGLPPADLSDDLVSSQGFRDTELAVPKPAGQQRVLCLGDSSVWGQGVIRAHSFPQRLEAALNPPDTTPENRPVEVINAGVPGYSSYQTLLVLEQSAGLGIDHVLQYALNSDLMPALGNEEHDALDSAAHELLAPNLHRLALTRWLHGLVWAALPPSRQPRGEHRVSLKAYRRNLEASVRLARQRGATITLVAPPQWQDLRYPAAPGLDGLSLAEIEQAIRDGWQGAERGRATREQYLWTLAWVATRYDVELIDAPSYFAARWYERPQDFLGPNALFVDAIHPSTTGHALLAELILPVLEPLRKEQPLGSEAD